MSLAINANNISAILLDDGWHEVLPGSADIDAYEIGYDNGDRFDLLHNAGTGIQWIEPQWEHSQKRHNGTIVYNAAPMEAVIAIRYEVHT